MAFTPHLGLTLVEQSQAQKEITVNEALARIDAVLNTGVIDKDIATPPGSPATGDVYIVAASPTGDWSGQAGRIAYYDQVWRFIAPQEGMQLWIKDEAVVYIYDGAAWQPQSPSPFVSAKAYGATGDGTTDDSSALQAAIDAVNTAGGGRVFLPAGTYRTTATLTLAANCSLEGAGQYICTIDAQHAGTAIAASNAGSEIRNLRIETPITTAGSGIKITAARVRLNRLTFTGGTASSWGIEIDATTDFDLEYIQMGGTGYDSLKGNGILIHNSDVATHAFNAGDGKLESVRIRLDSNSTTGIKIAGPDSSSYKCNNIDIKGNCWVIAGASVTGTTGIHLRNASRIGLWGVNLEGPLNIGVLEESAQSGGASSESNSYFGVRFLSGVTAYSAVGTPQKRTFIGGDNFPALTNFNDGDVVFPNGVWFINPINGNATTRLRDIGGDMQLDDGADTGSVQFIVSGSNPQIQPTESTTSTRLFLGKSSIRYVGLYPVAYIPPRTAVPAAVENGMISYCDGSGWNPFGDGYIGFCGYANGAWKKMH